MKGWLKLLAWFVFAGLVGIAGWRGADVPFHQQWPLYEALRNTAAIIFAVVGAWLAIVYPERLKVSLRKQAATTGRGNENGQRVVALMAPIVNSTFILAAVLLVGLAAPLLRGLPVVVENLALCRGLSYALLTSLTLWQLWTVVLTLVPASEVTDRASRDHALQNTAADVFSNTVPREKAPRDGDHH